MILAARLDVCVVGSLLAALVAMNLYGGQAAGEAGVPRAPSVNVGQNPVAAAVDNGTGHVFVLDLGPINRIGNPTNSGRVSMFSEHSTVILRTTRVGFDPNAVVVDSPLEHVFVVNGGSYSASGVHSHAGTVSILNSRTGNLLRTVRVGVYPAAAAVADHGARVLVVNRGAQGFRGSVSILDARRGFVVRTVPVGVYPVAVAVDDNLDEAYVTNRVSNTVSVIDPLSGRLRATVHLGSAPGTVTREAVDVPARRDYVASPAPRVEGRGEMGAGHVTVIDAETDRVLRTLTVPNPSDIDSDGRLGRVYIAVTRRSAGFIRALEVKTGAALWTHPVGLDPIAIGIDQRAARVLVINRRSQTVAVLDARSGRTVCTATVGKNPDAITIDTRTHRAIVVNGGADSVTIVKDRC